jgi:glyoxylase-like metal-dependent hydrolase (beta-lactamase superfamily II)
VSNLYSWQKAKIKVTKIPEMELHNIDASFLFPQWNEKEGHLAMKGLGDEFREERENQVQLSTHSWLVETEEHTFLIDTASGNDKIRPLNPGFNQLNTRWLTHLAAAGISPEQIDFVFLSHLHVDHVGWNTRLINSRWVPTFPNARYFFSAREFSFYSDEKNVGEPSKGIFADSIIPVIEAGQAVPVDAEDPLPVPGLKIHKTPGHSHDHWSYSLTSEGETLFFWGDVMHHPLQLRIPGWHSVYCEDKPASITSREWSVAFALEHHAAIFTTHFPGTSAGSLQKSAQGLCWAPYK